VHGPWRNLVGLVDQARVAPCPVNALDLPTSTTLSEHPGPRISQDVCCDLAQSLPRERSDLNPQLSGDDLIDPRRQHLQPLRQHRGTRQ